MSTAAAPTSELPPSSPLSVTEREELLQLRRWKAQQQQQRLHIINALQPLCHVGLDDELSKHHHSACKEPSAAAAASFSSSTTQNTPLLHTTTPSKACCCCCGCPYCGGSQQHNTTTEKEPHHHQMRRSSPSPLEWEELQRSVRQLNEETVLLRAKLTAANVRSTHRLFDITPSTTVQLELRQATRTKKVMVAVTEALRRSVATRLSSPSPPPQPSGGAPCCSSIEVKAPQSNRTNGDPSSKHTTYRAPQNNCSRLYARLNLQRQQTTTTRETQVAH